MHCGSGIPAKHRLNDWDRLKEGAQHKSVYWRRECMTQSQTEGSRQVTSEKDVPRKRGGGGERWTVLPGEVHALPSCLRLSLFDE